VYNQRNQLTKVPEPLLLDNAVCVAPINQLAMLHEYANPAEKLIADPNQDVVYGLGYLSLEKEPVVLQAPDFGDRFGRFRYMTLAPIRSPSLDCNTAPSPAST
jgi:hypothetical protein